MIIYANLQSNLSISFGEDDFQRINMHNHWKNIQAPVEGSLDDHLCQSTVKYVY